MEDEFLNERRGYILYLKPIVIRAIETVGLEAFKKTSLFISNRPPLKDNGR